MKYRSLFLMLALLLSHVFSSEVWAGRPNSLVASMARPKLVPNEIIVRLKGNLNNRVSLRLSRDLLKEELDNWIKKENLRNKSLFSQGYQMKTMASFEALQVISLNGKVRKGQAPEKQAEKIIEHLRKSSLVEYAVQNQYRYIDVVGEPNDDGFEQQWALENRGQDIGGNLRGYPGSDINVLPVWRKGFTGSKDIIVAVIDSGVDIKHEDLKDNIYTNEIEKNGSSWKDDDQNGYKNDIHGYDFIRNRGDGQDDHGHGSHCAGVIGAMTNNEVGISGVNWDVSILPLKTFNKKGQGKDSDIIEAIHYARNMKVDIMSNSWGGGDENPALKEAIELTRDAGIVFVLSAGNGSADVEKENVFPVLHNVENMITVAAHTNMDRLADFSNFNPKYVHLAAPGHIIMSTVIGSYYPMSGTSMSAPYVSGAAALLLSIHPEWDVPTLKDRLIRSSVEVPHLRDKVMAKGRLNIFNALEGIFPDKTPPQNWEAFFYPKKTPHPIPANAKRTYRFSVYGAKKLRVHFEKFEFSDIYDKVELYEKSGRLIQELKVPESEGQKLDFYSEWAETDELTLKLELGPGPKGFGFEIDRVEVIY